MKKILSTSILLVLSLTMIFTLTSCNRASEEKIKEIDTLISQYDAKIKLCDKGVKMYPALEDEAEYTKIVEETKKLMVKINDEAAEIMKAYEEDNGRYTPEEADEIIAALKIQVDAADVFLKQLKDDLKLLDIDFEIE